MPSSSLAPTGTSSALVDRVLAWYAATARDLPWRRPDATPWAVMVSEFMLQQTPVSRVLPIYAIWIERWPTPTALAAASPGDAIRAWGRLGYPRRAVRLHAAAVAIVEQHAGEVPNSAAALRALPGIGEYTAAAIATFAFRQRHPVLDTNVRRVLARSMLGTAQPASSVTVAERRMAETLLPDDAELAARFAIGLMELGALVCRARSPDCDGCPIAVRCAWRLGGQQAQPASIRRQPGYVGTDRQCRGAILAVLRASAAPVDARRFDEAWPDGVQRARALDSLVADGLVEPLARGRFQLPS